MTGNRHSKQPSMADVGRRANVSAQTVSRFFTGGYLSDETRQRVEQAVAELGYRRNRLPASLRRNRTDTIGYVTVGPLNYGSTGILTGLGRAAQAAGQSLITSQLDLDPENPRAAVEIQHALDTFLSLRVDGIIAGSPYLGLEPVIRTVAPSIPVVALSDRLGDDVDWVRPDSYGAAALAVEHLANLGHRRIIHLAGPSSTNEAAERERGYREAMARFGLPEMPVLNSDSWTSAGGADCARRATPGDFTAVFAGNDELALGFTAAMQSKGVTCPDDFSMVGVDDMPSTMFYTPALTSVRIDFEHMGEVAFDMLYRRIQTGQRSHSTVLATQLTVRHSTRPSATSGRPSAGHVPGS